MIRISVATDVVATTVSGPGLVAQPLRSGAQPQPVAASRAEIRLSEDALLVNGDPVEGAGLSLTAEGRISIGPRTVGREVEVRRSPSGLSVVAVLPLEDYVAAVTGAEMPPSFPPEALKAQSVAARTYAVAKKLELAGSGRDSDLGATVLDQVYPSEGEPDPRARAAVAATTGEVLVWEHEAIEAFFHSACGGRTERGGDALGRDLPYLRSVACGQCGAAPLARWSRTFGAAELGKLAGLGGPATQARVVRRTATGRVARAELAAGGHKVALTGAELRRRLGYGALPSLGFSIEKAGSGFRFVGRGSGHGAGLCQWGAAGFARSGRSYQEILAHYYPGAELVKMY
jgi:stage II sporulation protein D